MVFPSLQPLPEAIPVKTALPLRLFGDAVMIVEFLKTFGPLFNMKEVITSEVTFGKDAVQFL